MDLIVLPCFTRAYEGDFGLHFRSHIVRSSSIDRTERSSLINILGCRSSPRLPYERHRNPGCFQSSAWICFSSKPLSSASISLLARRLLSAFMNIKIRNAVSKVALEVARFRPLPIGKFGASVGGKDHVEIKPPMLPIITVVPIAAERAVSETTFAEDCALQRAPNENAPSAIRNEAPYRACGSSVA